MSDVEGPSEDESRGGAEDPDLSPGALVESWGVGGGWLSPYDGVEVWGYMCRVY